MAQNGFQKANSGKLPRVDIMMVASFLTTNDKFVGAELKGVKNARRMFPTIQVSVCGLEPDSLYFVFLDMVPACKGRLKFMSGQWEIACPEDSRLLPPSGPCCYVHPDSPARGSHWMSHPVSMHRAKVTNNITPEHGSITLVSMHKFQPRIHIMQASDFAALPTSPRAVFVFPLTQFVAVTAYQNKRITTLKIDHNPFAKGFREKDTPMFAGCPRSSKRKRSCTEQQPIKDGSVCSQPARGVTSTQSSEGGSQQLVAASPLPTGSVNRYSFLLQEPPQDTGPLAHLFYPLPASSVTQENSVVKYQGAVFPDTGSGPENPQAVCASNHGSFALCVGVNDDSGVSSRGSPTPSPSPSSTPPSSWDFLAWSAARTHPLTLQLWSRYPYLFPPPPPLLYPGMPFALPPFHTFLPHMFDTPTTTH